MPYEIVMPRLGWNMEEGTLVEWLKQDGDPIIQGEMVCTIEGDKAAADVESFEAGILKIPDASPPPGQTVPVGTLLGFVVAEHEIETFDPNAGRAGDAGNEDVAVGPAEGTAPAGTSFPDPGTGTELERATPVATGLERGAPAISPRAKRAAHTAGIDWRTLEGTGRSGRIVERDVLEAARQHEGARQHEAARPHEAAVDGTDGKAGAGHSDMRQVITGHGEMRQVIARRMVEAHQTTAPVTLNTEADVTALSSLFKGAYRPSWYDLMAGITAVALAEHPVMNASWRDGVVLNDGIHIGIAVDTSGGVIAPVIRDVPGKSLQEIAAATKSLIQAAQDGGLTLEQIEGGTFTLTNLGMYDVDAFTPIIHYPQCAILGLGRAAPRVVVVDESSGKTGVRRMMALSLTFDHRIVDGAPAARFLQRIKQLAEVPESVFGRAGGIQNRPS
ncbi:MAG: 2-oxo acid dehydrogenase subunit E2 [Gemmatimonadetes bacterium]|nr:2-oxo acid dehydrogenase subunit E2 [Gemmatimonadota bacterium]MYG84053.1 2-oxo acid dehydrogenase subunit E2 [Gemmatimonadota bacterium]MYJ89489.1 2-oxo acid dehydrogenase subunit E2 [Gemmatimonadota bacterium]